MGSPPASDLATRPAGTLAGRVALTVVTGALSVLAVLGLAVAARWTPLLHLDVAVSRDLYAGNDRPRLLGAGLEVLTAPGLTAVRALVLLPLAGWLAVRARVRTAAWVAVAALGIGPLTTALKELTGRLRPGFTEGGDRYDSPSFPSGHASGIATLVGVLLVLGWPRLTAAARRRALAGGVVVAVLVATTRLWLGVHYLSDVAGGLALGTAWTLLTALAAGALPGGRAALPPRGASR